MAAEFRPDVIHLNTFGHGEVSFARPTVVTAHSCVLSWWQAVKGVAAPAEWDPYRAAVARALNSASAVTVPSGFMAAATGEHYGFDQTSIRVIHNGRNPRAFHAAPKEPFVLSAGRLWDEGKNAAALAAIAPSLSWPVCMAGEGRVEGVSRTGNAAGE